MMHLKTLKQIPNKLLIFTISGLRPLLGGDARCRFTLTCTPYAIKTLKEENFFKAVFLISKRVLSCNPFF